MNQEVEKKEKVLRVIGEEEAEAPVRTRKPARVIGGEEADLPKKKKAARNDAAEAEGTPKSKKKKKKSKKKKGKGNSGDTFMRLGRGLRSGSVTVTEYGKRAMHFFNAFTAGEDGTDVFARRGFLKRIAWLRRLRFSTFIVAAVLVLALTLLFFNNTNIQVEHITVSVAGLSKDLEGYTIVLLSDMHGRSFGTNQATLLRAINGEEYDLMVLAGDMVGAQGDPQPLYDLLDGLTGNKPVYFIAGDSDPGPLRDSPRVVEGMLEEFVLEDWVLGAIERGATYLDSPEYITVESSRLWLTPGDMLNVEASATTSSLNKQVHVETAEVLNEQAAAYNALPFTSYRQQNMQALLDTTTQMKGEDLHISVSHMPLHSAPRVSDGTDNYLPTVDLILAGHNCGGVWKLPLIGALYIPSVEAPRHGWFPAKNEVEGLRMLGSVSMYVTGGLGVTDAVYLPDFRLNNQPKVSILHLTAALTDDLLGLND